MKKILLSFITGLLLTACANNQNSKPLSVVELKDGDTFELKLGSIQHQINDRHYSMLAYNGIIPGPLFKIKQGSEITLNLRNELDEPTMLHPHGVRVDNGADGTHLTQSPIQPGATFTQTLKFPDPGMYWYHPHLREDRQQDLGLYGNFLVTPEDPNYWSPVNREEAIILDDIEVKEGSLPDYNGPATHTLMGRFGNVMLANGQTRYRLTAKQAEVVRFYFTNAANTRTFNIGIKNAAMKLVGGDGGSLEQEEMMDRIVLSPSERAVVEVLFEKPGRYPLLHETPEKIYELGEIEVVDEPVDVSYADSFSVLRKNNELKSALAFARSFLDKTPDKKLKISVETKGILSSGGHGQAVGHRAPQKNPQPIEWEDSIGKTNTVSNKENVRWKLIDEETGQVNDEVEWNFKVGDKVKISIFNDPKSPHPMQHPIHFHGQRFLVLAQDSKPNDNLGWKDSVLVKTGETVDLLLEVSNPGAWMAHCHISEHLEDGMMIKFNII